MICFFSIRIVHWLSLMLVMQIGSAFCQETDCYARSRKLAKDWLNECKIIYKTNPRYVTELLTQATAEVPDFIEAYNFLGEMNYRSAKKAIEDLIHIDRLEQFRLSSRDYFLKVVEMDSSYNSFLPNYYLGEFYYEIKRYDSAHHYLKVFLNNHFLQCELIDKAIEMQANIDFYFSLINNPVNFIPKPVLGVSSEADEYLPTITPDGQLMYYTRRKAKKNNNSEVSESFYVSHRLNSQEAVIDKFSNGDAMPFPFNQGKNQGGASITIDNKTMYLTICENERFASTSYKNCDIYFSEMKGDKWTNPLKLPSFINGIGTWEAQPSITSDGKVLFFASSREGGYGGIDIYFTKKDTFGNWLKPENLGPAINSAGDEKTPFIHTDTETLYFSSNGRFGMGGYDIYYSHYLGKGQWTKPNNIGYPINTANDDLAFIVSTSGEKIYFSSNELSGKGGYDIYSSPLHEEARPGKVLFVKGKLTDEYGKVLQNAQIELQSVKTLKLTRGLVDPLTGQYAIAATMKDKDDEFILTVKRDSIFFASQYIKPSEKDLNNPPKTIDFEIKWIKVGTKIKLENVYFAYNSDELDKNSTVSLNNFADFLSVNPSVYISLYGHTDSEGEEDFNLDLSQRRANKVKNYLVNKGIGSERMITYGYGEMRPIASNATAKGRASNRRTEFVVTVW